MNLRILKKLSKRAAPLLPLLGDNREQFRAEKCDNYTHTRITDRKHWERQGGCHPSHYPAKRLQPGELYYKTRKGGVVHMSNHYVHPRKGTIMVGAVSGYYEPEWDEETAWDSLYASVYGHFTHYNENLDPFLTRQIDSVSDVFEAARDILSGRAALSDGEGER